MSSRPPHAERGSIDGVRVLRLDEHRDERGAFTEVFSNAWGAAVEPVQWSVVRSAVGVLRGMHLHLRHDEYIHVVHGRASIGLYDLRPDSPTQGRSELFELSGDDPACVTFPAGIVHGWLFHEPTTHLQAVSETYVDYCDDDNNGCHWSDPELGIAWPFAPTIVSPRADSFGSLSDLRHSSAVDVTSRSGSR